MSNRTIHYPSSNIISHEHAQSRHPLLLPHPDTEGLAILQHPQNPGYPAPWFTRDYGFLSPTPMFWPANGKDTRITKGGELRLSYRVLVFSGTAETAGISGIFTEFSASKPEPVK